MESDLSQFKWDSVALRMTAFPAPGSEITVTGWWESVAGEVPEQQTVNPRAGEFLEHGEYGNGRLELKINPASVNWIHRVDELPPEKGPVTLGEFQSSCEKFCSLMNKWFDLDAAPNLVRLAFGASLIQPVQSQKEGLERLARYIPAVKIDPAHSSDFLYQINRGRASKLDIEGLAINRVMKWSVTQHQLFLLDPAASGNVASAPPESYVRLGIDINTMQDFEGVFRKEDFVRVFDELVEIGKEIAEEGDIP